MGLTNAFIIYFALGVPFGVLAAYLRFERLLPGDVFRVTYHLAFWPFILIFRGLTALGTSVPGHFGGTDRTVSIHRNNLINRDVRSRRAILEGLQHAYRTSETAVVLRLPFEDCIEHPDPQLAARCFQRRNLRRLERHIAGARNDLATSMGETAFVRPAERTARSDGQEDTVHDLC